MLNKFEQRIEDTHHGPLTADSLRVLQVNAGYMCNMACKHCHVVAGPKRPEVMGKDTIERVLHVIKEFDIRTLDITGGAPELNPHFSYLVRAAREAACHVVARTNLTVFFEKGFEQLPEFYSDHCVEINASLPGYHDRDVDMVRGDGAFRKGIKALQRLNSLGYGVGSDIRRLNLVYNPPDMFLAHSQECLEKEYRSQLGAHYGISFDRLFVFSNMPIGRFKDHLEKTGFLEKYMNMLKGSFNPATLEGLMCRSQISVGWDGTLYDCDFNQALGLNIHDSCPKSIREFDIERLARRNITVGDHCYGCTAGQGST